MPHILTLNSGSSSLKFGSFVLSGQEPIQVCSGIVDQIGSNRGLISVQKMDGTVAAKPEPRPIANHADAVTHALSLLTEAFPGMDFTAIGHRVVHGGANHAAPVRLTPNIVSELESLAPFAPLHQPHNLVGIQAAIARFPQAIQVACFDTAFHRGQPFEADAFALPLEYHRKGVRRYGFHGLSYEYISRHLPETFPDLRTEQVIVAHLGNGASMCALLNGRSVASTMGFSVLDGLPMGTRCGQIDPGVLLYLMEQEELGIGEISDLLYRKSGLLGLSGISNDMRVLERTATPEANRAISCFTYRIRYELGGLAAVLGGLDALVFTGGIGENSQRIRSEVCTGMGLFGLKLDPEANSANKPQISTGDSTTHILVLSTNEEQVIARAVAREL